MEFIKTVNISLRFLLELCSLFAIGYWGFYINKGILFKISLGIGSPLTIAFIWAMFGSPKAPFPVYFGLRLALELFIYTFATYAIYVTGHQKLAIVFIIIAIANLILMYIWDQ